MKLSPIRMTALILATALALPLSQAVVSAQDAVLTESQATELRSQCSNIQAMLHQVHANDALIRVDQGRRYDHLSTKLIAAFNSRVALNRLDGTSLVAITSVYERHLQEFRSRYQVYERSLSGVMRVNCSTEPARFYGQLELARQERARVHASIQDLTKDITGYKQAFDQFAAQHKDEDTQP